jgi:hypothetical protein
MGCGSEAVHNLAERKPQVKGIGPHWAQEILTEDDNMTIFVKYIKALTILALLAGGLSACAAPGGYDLGKFSRVDRLQQAG